MLPANATATGGIKSGLGALNGPRFDGSSPKTPGSRRIGSGGLKFGHPGPILGDRRRSNLLRDVLKTGQFPASRRGIP
jgi:hypothetical protein